MLGSCPVLPLALYRTPPLLALRGKSGSSLRGWWLTMTSWNSSSFTSWPHLTRALPPRPSSGTGAPPVGVNWVKEVSKVELYFTSGFTDAPMPSVPVKLLAWYDSIRSGVTVFDSLLNKDAIASVLGWRMGLGEVGVTQSLLRGWPFRRIPFQHVSHQSQCFSWCICNDCVQRGGCKLWELEIHRSRKLWSFWPFAPVWRSQNGTNFEYFVDFRISGKKRPVRNKEYASDYFLFLVGSLLTAT